MFDRVLCGTGVQLELINAPFDAGWVPAQGWGPREERGVSARAKQLGPYIRMIRVDCPPFKNGSARGFVIFRNFPLTSQLPEKRCEAAWDDRKQGLIPMLFAICFLIIRCFTHWAFKFEQHYSHLIFKNHLKANYTVSEQLSFFFIIK